MRHKKPLFLHLKREDGKLEYDYNECKKIAQDIWFNATFTPTTAESDTRDRAASSTDPRSDTAGRTGVVSTSGTDTRESPVHSARSHRTEDSFVIVDGSEEP